MAIDVASEAVNEDWTGASGTTFTVTKTVAAGSVLVLFATLDYSNGVTSATVADNLNGAWPAQLSASPVDDTVDTQRLAAFVFRGTAAGSLTATITYVGATGAFRGLWLMEVTGANTSAAVDGNASQSQITVGTGTDAVTSGNFTTTGTPVMLIGMQGNFSALPGLAAAGTGFTSGTTGFGANARSEWKRDATAAGTKSVTFTNTTPNGTRITFGLAIDEAAAAVPAAPPSIQPDPFNIVGPGRFKGGPRFRTQTFDTARTVQLAGSSVTASAGTLTPAMSVPLVGSSVTGSAGTLTPSSTVPLTGQSVTVSAGSVTAGGDINVALTGQSVTVSAGTLTPSSSVPLAGSAVTVSAGTLTPAAAVPLAGSSVTTSAGTLVPSSAVPLTGSAVTASAGTLTAAGGATDCLYRASVNGRYINRDGSPFFILGDSAFGLNNQMSLVDVASYLTTRASQGFNAIFLSMICHETNVVNAPADVNGDLPFTTKSGGGAYIGTSATADFSTPNDTYFAYLKSVIDLCELRGFLVMAYVCPWGIAGGGTAGFWPDLINAANTQTVCTNFGTYLANGHGTFGGFKNNRGLILMNGSDYGQNRVSDPPTTEGETRALKITQGMVAAGSTQLQSGDWQAPSMSTDEPIFTAWMQLNGAYTYDSTYPDSTSPSSTLHTYLQSRAGYNYVPTSGTQSQTGVTPSALPVYLKETVYEHSPFAGVSPPPTIAEVRKAQNWAWLSGCTTGIFYGDEHVWTFPLNGSWSNALTDTSALDFARFSTFVRSLKWWLLVPSELASMRQLIVGARGSQSGAPDDYIAAACAENGSFMVAYVPVSGSGAQTFSVDARSLLGTARARWWDPTNGTFTAATPSLIPSTASSQSLTTPGNNSAGDNDWILLLDVPSSGFSSSLSPFEMVGPGRFRGGPRHAPSKMFAEVTASTAVTVALTGQSVTVSAGTLTPNAAVPLAGSSVTASAGTLVQSASVPVTGQSVTVSAGTPVANAAVPMAGSSVTVSAGTVTAAPSVPLVGSSVTASTGTLVPSASVALAGSAVAVSAGSMSASAPGTASLTGVAVTVSAGTLSPDISVALVGSSVAVSAGDLVPSMARALTGASVAVSAGTMVADGGSTITPDTGIRFAREVLAQFDIMIAIVVANPKPHRLKPSGYRVTLDREPDSGVDGFYYLDLQAVRPKARYFGIGEDIWEGTVVVQLGFYRGGGDKGGRTVSGDRRSVVDYASTDSAKVADVCSNPENYDSSTSGIRVVTLQGFQRVFDKKHFEVWEVTFAVEWQSVVSTT